MRLIVVRHGETTANTLFMIQGQLDTEVTWLTEKGESQALNAGQRLGNYLRRNNITIRDFYSSPLRRAFRTAELIRPSIKEFLINTQIQPLDGLKEMGAGENEGVRCKTHEELHTKGYEKTPSGESREGFQNRVIGTTFEIARGHDASDTVLFTCHGGTIQALKNGLEDKPVNDFILQSVPPTGGIIVFDVSILEAAVKLCCNKVELVNEIPKCSIR